MRISTKGRYALRAVLEMAENGKDEYLPLHVLADRQGLSEKYLESILALLVRAKIVDGVRGKGGGYRLICDLKKTTVFDILRCTEKELSPVDCLEGERLGCERATFCASLPVWKELKDIIENYLSSISLAKLLKKDPHKKTHFCSDDLDPRH